MQTPLVSVIIVNWNGRKWLAPCLNSLLAQTYPNIEIIVVDNASTDGSVSYLKEQFPAVRVVTSSANLGFAGGNNLGLKHAAGEFLMLLNNDTEMTSGCLERLVAAFDEVPEAGAIQPKLVLLSDPKRLDVCGSYWTRSAFLYHFGYGKDQALPDYNRMQTVFSNKGAAMMLPRRVVEKVGLFDEDFWCYYEETDLCHRLWLAGYECWYDPGAKVLHAMGGTSLAFDNSHIQFHNFKNKLLSFLKNFQIRTLMTVLPVYFILNIGLSFVWLLKGRYRHFWALYRAIGWNLQHLKATLVKRRAVQSLRKTGDAGIFAQVERNPRPDYYRFLLKGALESYVD